MIAVDGVSALRPELDGQWDVRVWGDVDREVSLRRGVDRDAARAGGSHAEAPVLGRYGPAEDPYIAEVDPSSRADVVVDNTCFDDPTSSGPAHDPAR